MVGHVPLEDGIGVRVPVRQQSFKIRFFAKIRSVASLCDAPHFGENGDSIFWLGDRDSNPDTQDQNLVSYH